MHILLACKNHAQARQKYLAAQLLFHGRTIRAQEFPRGVYLAEVGTRNQLTLSIVALDKCTERTFCAASYDLVVWFATPTKEIRDVVACCDHGRSGLCDS